MRNTLSLLILALALSTVSLAKAQDAAPERWKLGGYVEQDLGVLLLFGGVGLHGGVTVGNWRFGLGFFRFKSSHRSLSGAPKGFGLEVQGVLEANVAYHPFSKRADGPYIRALAQVKRQQAENRDNGARRDLDSALVGPEIGWVFRLYHGLYVAPKLGALYYARPPQGAGNHPVDIGGRAYDNDRHKTFDFYGTVGVGYLFD